MRQISTYVNKRDKKVNLIFKVRGHRFTIATPISSSVKFTGTEVPQSEIGYKTKTAVMRKYYVECEEYIHKHEDMPIDRLKQGLRTIITGAEVTDRKVTLADHIRQFAETKKAKNTKLTYLCTANNVEKFDKDATLAIDADWLRRFEKHEKDKGRVTNGISIDLRNIRAVFNHAIANGAKIGYPFRGFKIHQEQTRKRNLSVDDLRRIVAHGGRYTDTFTLMVYLLGININDLYYLPKDAVRNGRLEYRRNKTGRLFSIKVEPEAEALINKYAGKEYLLSFAESCANYKDFLKHMNDTLKEIVTGCTSYWSRHTWASLAVSLDIPIETVSAALGHSVGLSVTNIYIAYDNKKVDKANRKVIDHINKM